MRLMCGLCQRTPDQIDYTIFRSPNQSNDEYVLTEEGTLDPETGLFLCDECYIRAGQPSGPDGRRWTCTLPHLIELKALGY